MKSKQIKKQKKDKSRQKTKKLKQKQKQRQVQRQVVNVTSSGGSGGGYPQPQPQPLYAAPQTLASKIAEFKAIRQAINVNDRDPEEKNIQENAINKMDENNIYNNDEDIAQQENLQQQSGLKVPRFSISEKKNKNISYQGLSDQGSPVAFNISLDQISAEKNKNKQLIPTPPPKTPPKAVKSEKQEDQEVKSKKPGPGRPKKNPTK
jgi:hypothetical protein